MLLLMFIFLYVGTSTTFSGSYGAHSCSSNNYFNNANYERNVNLAFSSLENNIKIHVIIQERKKKTETSVMLLHFARATLLSIFASCV